MSTETHTHLHVNAQELDTILAALRYWQREGLQSDPRAELKIAEEHGSALDIDGVGDLCEAINMDGKSNHPLDEVFAILDGQEWNAEHFEAIADVLREHGYNVRDPDEVEEEA